MNELTIYNKINTLPDELKKEVMDFIDFIISKKPVKKAVKHPKAGFLKGTFIIKDGFDEPLEDFKEYM